MNFRIFLCLLFPLCVFCQQPKKYRIRCIVFYNVENLFDIENDSLIFDEDRTPEGAYHWTSKRYQKKIDNITKVLTRLGTEKTGTTPDVIGLCEVENRKVLNDLIEHPRLKIHDYGIVHFPSPDKRGIDVALLYKRKAFLPTEFNSHRLIIHDDYGKRIYTRDQLVVHGILDDESFYFLVNHWPSRRGGELKSRPNRIKAAQLNKHIMDSIRNLDINAKIISMGDFNDDPRNDSFKKVLLTKSELDSLQSTDYFNPMEKLYNKGFGSLAYRDQWNLFDQFVMTANLTKKNTGFFFWKANIYAPRFLRTKRGRYQGYPFRTYSGTTYQGGYSDHFPVYLYLLKETAKKP